MDAHGLDTLDLALRAGLVALSLLLAALLLREHRRDTAARLGAALALGVAAYAVQSRAGFAMPAQWWQAPVLALSAGNAVVFWLFSRAVFDDEFELRPGHAAAWAALAAAPVVNCFWLLPGDRASAHHMGLAIASATFGFSLLAVGQTLSTWRADLVEGRRRLRVFVVAAGAIYTAVATMSRLSSGAGVASAWFGIADMLGLGSIVVVMAWHMLRAPALGMFEPRPTAATRVLAVEPVPSTVPTHAADPADARLAAQLDRLMAIDHVHREAGLTIGTLAERLGVPEHRLRKLINQRLGHRNFNSFLNGYRLADAKAALADPARSEVPVLTIAMDAGFQSLGPFNRAFKADTGLTPTEFRRLGWREEPAESRIPLADFKIGQ